jgi:hypothetical protein
VKGVLEAFIVLCAFLGFFVLLWAIGLYGADTVTVALVAGMSGFLGYVLGRWRGGRLLP